jgi:hypothetical protein
MEKRVPSTGKTLQEWGEEIFYDQAWIDWARNAVKVEGAGRMTDLEKVELAVRRILTKSWGLQHTTTAALRLMLTDLADEIAKIALEKK